MAVPWRWRCLGDFRVVGAWWRCLGGGGGGRGGRPVGVAFASKYEDMAFRCFFSFSLILSSRVFLDYYASIKLVEIIF